MEFEFKYSTPKLSLSKYPKTNKSQKEKNNIVMVTPPIRTLAASIIFQWEEAPGKPRNTHSLSNSTTKNNRTVRRLVLDLPPSQFVIDTNPPVDNVITSPTTVLEGPYICRTMSSRTVFSLFNDGASSGKKKRLRFGGSWRWGSFKEVKIDTNLMRNNSRMNITRMPRKKSFFANFSRTSLNLVGDIYENLKQVVQLGHGQEKSSSRSINN